MIVLRTVRLLRQSGCYLPPASRWLLSVGTDDLWNPWVISGFLGIGLLSVVVNTCVVRFRLAATITYSSRHTFSSHQSLTDKQTCRNLYDSTAKITRGSTGKFFFLLKTFNIFNCWPCCLINSFHHIINTWVVFVEEGWNNIFLKYENVKGKGHGIHIPS